MSMIKYRVHEVAKDFNVPTKVITQILTDYAATPKNHMQVLENHELDVIFEYMTQHNQAENLADIFAVSTKEEPKSESKSENKDSKKPAEKNGAKNEGKPQEKNAPAAQPAKTEKVEKIHVPRPVAEKRVVDTRGGAAVNIEKYNEKFEDMAGAKARGDNMNRSNKEKINSKSKQRGNQ